MPEKNYCMGIYEFDQDRNDLFRNEIKTIVESHMGVSFEDAGVYYESESIKMNFIERMIVDANLIIADITRLNANVFLELGVAYAFRKKIILLCERAAWETGCLTMIPGNDGKSPTRVRAAWKRNPPFDLSGRDILIYEDYNELKIKLSESLFDAFFGNKIAVPSWSSSVTELSTGKYSMPTSHIISPGKLSLVHEKQDAYKNKEDNYEFEFGKAWNSFPINNTFHFTCKVELRETIAPDFRFCMSTEKDGRQRIVVIFPWELDNDKNKSCHIAYYDDYTRHNEENSHVRLQMVDVGVIKKEFRFSFSMCWPHLVVESDIFPNKIDRLCVSLDQLRGFGYPIHQKQFIGFNVRHGQARISDIKIKEAP